MDTLILDLPAGRTVKDTFPLFKAAGLCYFLLQQSEPRTEMLVTLDENADNQISIKEQLDLKINVTSFKDCWLYHTYPYV